MRCPRLDWKLRWSLVLGPLTLAPVAAPAASATWHLTAQAYSFHERTT